MMSVRIVIGFFVGLGLLAAIGGCTRIEPKEELAAKQAVRAEGQQGEQLVRQGVDEDLDLSSAPTTSQGHEGQHGKPNMNPLEWQENLAIWTGVIFLVLLLILWKFAWGPIADGLAKREQGIAGQISEAEAANRDAKQLLAEYQQKLDATGEQVRQMIQQARRDAEKAGAEIVDAARADARNEQKKALIEIDQATNAALGELAQRSAELAVDLAGKIVKTKLRPEDHAELVQEAVAGFTAPNKAK